MSQHHDPRPHHGHDPRPDREPQPRTIVLTFDNLGEASALQRGTWDAQTPLGRDPSVTEALPRLLDALDDSGLRATFFVEAINCRLNPGALQSIAARGHELGVHGFEHEEWGALDASTERALLERSTEAFAALELDPRGFRPPGGELTVRTPSLLRELGFAWCSPARESVPAAGEGPTAIAFDWELVDAFHLMERFADLRVQRGAARAAAGPRAAGERMEAALRADHRETAVRTVVMHPFLMLDAGWWAQVERLLALVATLGRVVPGGEAARSRVGP